MKYVFILFFFLLAASVGNYHACVLEEGGSVQCWGDNDDGESTVPKNLDSVIQVSATGALVVLCKRMA